MFIDTEEIAVSMDEHSGLKTKRVLQRYAIRDFACPHCNASPTMNCTMWPFPAWFARQKRPHVERYVIALMVHGAPHSTGVK